MSADIRKYLQLKAFHCAIRFSPTRKGLLLVNEVLQCKQQSLSESNEHALSHTSLTVCELIVQYLTIIRRRQGEYCRTIPETKSRGLFDNIHRA